LAGDTTCIGVPEEDDVAHYGSGIGIRQITQFADRSGSGNSDMHVTHADVLHGGEGLSSRKKE
jgi:hypothetical protein